MGTLTYIIKNIHIMTKTHDQTTSVYPVQSLLYQTYNDKLEKRP